MNLSFPRSVPGALPRFGALVLPVLLAVAPLPAQGPINLGDLVVVRVGDGTAALTSGSTAVFLEEFTTTGAPVQTLPLPTAASGSNNPFTNSGTATSEGFLNLAADGQSLVCAGYATAPGTATIASTASTAVARAVARIALSGSIDTSTTLGSAFSAGNPRSVATPDGVQFVVAGSNSGAQYVILSTATPVQLNSAAPTNLRVANIFNGQLYVSSSSGSFFGVGTLGTGLPTTSGQTPSLLPGFPALSGPSAYDYWFANATTLYVADDRT